MSETTESSPTPDAGTPQRPERRWMLIVGLAAGVAVLAIGIAAFAITRDDDDRQPTATEQIAVARQACQQWLNSDTTATGPGPGPDWCDDMAGWMAGHMGSGPMMGGGMWASPDAMRDVCTRAMSGTRTAGGDPAQWCDQMVGWMTRHGGDWDDWHDNWDR